ncbi:hypothetical protein PPN31114_01509 [Pandoraea pneumonica]|uniref:Uncharacterized protein n=1 Tax=Pandoraea pneumonica TaxID=2508299 RepID=A0A5E4TLP5_9BURK|nr:hypothetical protein PPN31114_01509 [Pandoraea pneumonica]
MRHTVLGALSVRPQDGYSGATPWQPGVESLSLSRSGTMCPPRGEPQGDARVPYAERTVDIDVTQQAAVPHFEAPLFPRLWFAHPVRA